MKKVIVGAVFMLMLHLISEAQLGGIKDRLLEKTKQSAQKAAR
jgi:hypothetical protein